MMNDNTVTHLLLVLILANILDNGDVGQIEKFFLGLLKLFPSIGVVIAVLNQLLK